MEESRLPKGTEARNKYAETIGRDGMRILEAIYDHPTTQLWLRRNSCYRKPTNYLDTPILD